MIKMDVKGQVSAEYLLLVLVFLIILGSVTIPMIGKSIDSSMDVSSTSDVSAAVNSIANAVGIVYSNGPGSKRTINVYFPVSGTLSVSNNTLLMPVLTSNGTNKTIDAKLPYSTSIVNPAVTERNSYNVTVTWPIGTGPIAVTLTLA
jgi:uncharacterized protein (UPF0333 family)